MTALDLTAKHVINHSIPTPTHTFYYKDPSTFMSWLSVPSFWANPTNASRTCPQITLLNIWKFSGPPFTSFKSTCGFWNVHLPLALPLHLLVHSRKGLQALKHPCRYAITKNRFISSAHDFGRHFTFLIFALLKLTSFTALWILQLTSLYYLSSSTNLCCTFSFLLFIREIENESNKPLWKDYKLVSS